MQTITKERHLLRVKTLSLAVAGLIGAASSNVFAVGCNVNLTIGQDYNATSDCASSYAVRIRNAAAGTLTIDSGVTLSSTGLNAARDVGAVVLGTQFPATAPSSLQSLVNNGTISGGSAAGISMWGDGFSTTVSSLTNNGAITGVHAIHMVNTADIGTLTNNVGSSIIGDDHGILSQTGSIGSLLNYGTISGQAANGLSLGSAVTTVDNYGSITGNGHGIGMDNTLTTLNNYGTISGNHDTDIFNNGSLGTLVNSQSNLSYRGNLPSTYVTYFSDASTYGTVDFSNITGGTTLDTYGARIADGENWAAGTFTNVITSDSALTITNYEPISGISYQLVNVNNDGKTWNLVISGVSTSRVYDAAQALRNTPAGAAAQVIDADPALLAYFAGLTTDQQLSEAASQTLPLLVGATPQVIFNALGNTNRIIQDRPSANSGMNSGDEMLMDTHAWAKVFGSLHDQDDRNQVVGYDGHSKGLVFGFDGDLNDRTTLGVAFAYGNTNVTGNTNLNSAEIDSYQMVGYGSYAINDRTEVNFQADVGLSKTDGERIMVIPVAGQANSDYDSVSVHVGTGIAKSFDLGPRTQIAPTARIDYTRVDSDSYTETGSAAVTPFLNQVSSETAEALEVGLGAKLSHQVGDKTRLDAELGVAYDTMNEAATITSSFVGGGASFTTTGIKPDPWIKRLGLGITSTLNNGAEITASYDIDSRQDFTDQSVSVKFRMMF